MSVCMTRPRVLILDDDPGFCNSATRCLTTHGIDVAGVTSVRAAVAALEVGGFALLLVDEQYAFEVLVAHAARADAVPTVVFSSQPTSDPRGDLPPVLRGAVLAVLHKPLWWHELRYLIDHHVPASRPSRWSTLAAP